MRLLEELFIFLGIDPYDQEINRACTTFIKALVVMIMLVFILAFSLLVYNLVTHGVSENTTFGLIDYV